ncbi:MAG: tetratricopeptide repeat protein [Kofleriaceae bacterium]|nr:tetratricopeptide repeat protein [Kofleriaceae bacterium]
MGHRCAVLLTVAFALWSALATTAYAEELPQPAEPRAKARLDAGNKAFDEAKAATDATIKAEKFRAAIREYMAGLAVETKFHYTFYWNLGHAHRQLGEYTRAAFFYGKFLEFAPERLTNHRTSAEDFRRMMQAELDKSAAAEQAAALKPADTAHRTGDDNVKAPDGVVLPTPVQDPPRSEGPSWYSDRPAWGILGLGLGGTLVGGGFLLSSASLLDKASDEDRQSVKADLEDQAATRRTIGLISGGVGLACLTVGVIKLAITDSTPTNRTSVHVTVGPSSIAILGSF